MPGATWPWMNSRSPPWPSCGRVPEVVEAGVVERRRRLERRDVPAQLGALLVGAQHRRDRVPPVQRADAVLELEVAGMLGLLVHRDGVHVGGGRRERHRHGVQPGLVLQLLAAGTPPGRPRRTPRRSRAPPATPGSPAGPGPRASALLALHVFAGRCRAGSSLALWKAVRWHCGRRPSAPCGPVPAGAEGDRLCTVRCAAPQAARPIACEQRLEEKGLPYPFAPEPNEPTQHSGITAQTVASRRPFQPVVRPVPA